jgi:hypothetical protein
MRTTTELPDLHAPVESDLLTGTGEDDHSGGECERRKWEPRGATTIVVMDRRSIVDMERWRTDEVLEQVACAGEDAETVARALVGWADSHPCIRIKGGRGWFDRALTMYADSGRGKGVLSLYAAENGGGPMLELRIEQIFSMPPYDSDEARVQLTADLRALGVPRLDHGEILTATRPNIPLDQLTGGRLECLLTLVDRCIELGASPAPGDLPVARTAFRADPSAPLDWQQII